MSTPTGARRWDVRLPLETLAVFVVCMSGLGLLLARLGMFDAPPVWVTSLIAAGVYWHRARHWRLAADTVPAWHYGLLLGVGLLFRLTPDAYVLGGQDQGVYVNAAMHLAATGNLHPTDRVLEHLTDPAAVAIYRQSNYSPANYLPGVYATPGGLVFQFYHLFPVWMALFGDGSGPATAVYALTLLALLSLVFMHRLAYLLTGSERAALAAGLLLAVNPLHAFFSRFPVTEVPTLAFSLMGFTFLAEAWRHRDDEAGWRLPALGVASMACLFATRISGFMYMPIAALVGIAAALDSDPGRRRKLFGWTVGTLAAYVASVAYGLVWSRPYALDIYRASFGRHLGTHVFGLAVAGSCVAIAACLLLVSSSPVRRARLSNLLLAGARALPWLALLVVFAGCIQAYRLGYTDAFRADEWVGRRFGLSHQGLRSVFSTSLVVTAVYLSPFVFLAYFPAAFAAVRDRRLVLLAFFTTACFSVAVLLQPVLAYQPYYARYLLSEAVPYMTLLVVCAWALAAPGTRGRRWLAVALCAGGLYCAGLSAAQIGKSEHEGVAPALDRLAAHFDRGDVVLIDASMAVPGVTELKTPLVYVYGLNVVTATQGDLLLGDYLDDLDRSFDDVYLLTTGDATPPRFHQVDSVRYLERMFLRGSAPPVATGVRGESTIRVLRFAPGEAVDGTVAVTFGQGGTGNALLGAGWSAPERWGVWSAGDEAVLNLALDGDARGHAVELEGRAYVTPKVPVQTVRATVGADTVEATARYPDDRIHLRLPERMTAGQAHLLVRLAFPAAASPRALGYSNDPRVLAFGLERLRVMAPGAAAPR